MAVWKPVRRGQLISPFGVGAIINFPGDESLMIAGLDEWPSADGPCPSEWVVREERLQDLLGRDHFRLPPDFRKSDPNLELRGKRIPAVRFPGWHYCPRRGIMQQLGPFSEPKHCPCDPRLDCHSLKFKPRLIPVRFITACRQGHVDDFPFMAWLHDGQDPGDHTLRMLAGRSSAALSGIRVECRTCSARKSMAGLLRPGEDGEGPLGRLARCRGNMPWIADSEGCDETMQVLQRGASNVYFPAVVSSIYIPRWRSSESRRIKELLERHWDRILARVREGALDEGYLTGLADGHKVDADRLVAAARERAQGTAGRHQAGATREAEMRAEEYEALLVAGGQETDELMLSVRDAGEYGTGAVARLFSRLSLVKKLRETRVFRGFTRIVTPDDESAPAAVTLHRGDLRWLPAIVVRGEGVFMEINQDRLREWAAQPPVRDRIARLAAALNASRRGRGLPSRHVAPEFVLLHSIAHGLIVQLSVDCGYGSASLRERIYWGERASGGIMAGLLIYTAAGDSDGTLGGLVRQGEPDRFSITVDRALDRLSWCSSDPVCIESTGQGNENANLAACHGCLLVPETSCEHGNRFLDRGLIVGTLAPPQIGFSDNP